MPADSPDKYDYLAVVSEWSSTGNYGGGSVGNAYPMINLSKNELVSAPQEMFPNPGAVFLPTRGTLNTWEFIVLRPKRNERYRNGGDRDCYFIPYRQPTPVDTPAHAPDVAVVLPHAAFDPNASERRIFNPRCNVTPVFFVEKMGSYFGPLLRTQSQLSSMDTLQRIDWRPAADDGIIYEFTKKELEAEGLKFAEYVHPDPSLNDVIQAPLTFLLGKVLRAKSQRPRDAMPSEALIEWYLARCPEVNIPEELLTSLKSSFKMETHENPAIVTSRMSKIDKEMMTNSLFISQRERFAKRYVDSAEGQKRIAELVDQAVVRKGLEIQAEVDKRQRELAELRNRLDADLAAVQEDHRRKCQELVEARDAIAAENDRLREAGGELRAVLEGDVEQLGGRLREQVPLLAAVSGMVGRVATVQVNGHADFAPAAAPAAKKYVFAPVPPTTPLQSVTDEAKLVRDVHAALERQGFHFARTFIANVYACLKAEPLNLIIGPPGYGKSMLVSMLARVLGHGNALLRIPVRRSWGEDRYLLGSFDSFHNRYDPGPTGLVGRMLQAEADWKADKTGVYMVLLDEFNLAAPEYYFSQLLQALPSQDASREIALYDPAAASDGFPHKVQLTPNLRFWGTINYDETTERLSPRTLDRTGMIFLGDADTKADAVDDLPPMKGVTAKDLFDKFARTDAQCPEESWSLVTHVLNVLRKPDPDRGPRVDFSPRVLGAVKRYLANAAAVLDTKTAVDFVVQQRLLPVIRGRGEDFLLRIRDAHELLGKEGLNRSAHHVEESLRRAEQHFGELDFLSY